MMRPLLNNKWQQRLCNSVLLFSFFLISQVADAQSNPNVPDFSRHKGVKEEFMQRRAEAIAQLRGVEKDKPFDPNKRIQAVRQMELQKAQLLANPSSRRNSMLDAAWTEIGPNPIPNGQVNNGPQLAVSGRTVAIAVNPSDPNIVFVGTAQGGLYRSLDGGTTWVPLLDNALSLAVNTVAIAPSQPTTIFVGTGEGSFSGDSYFGVGIYRIDNANSASPTITGPIGGAFFTGRSVTKIVVHPSNPNIIFATSASGIGGIGGTANNVLADRGVFRSTDALSAAPSFTKLTIAGLAAQNRSFVDMVMDPGNPDLVLCTELDSFNLGEGGVYRSTNALSAAPTFTRTFTSGVGTDPSRTELALNRSGGGVVTVYAASGLNGGTVQLSIDGGATWTQQIDNNFCTPQCFYDIAIAVDPVDATRVYLGGSPTLVFGISTNSGLSFTNNVTTASGLHVDSHVIGVSPSTPSTIYFGSDGGIYKSTNSGSTWVSLNNGTFRATQFMGLAVHPTDPNYTIGGTQDNGTNMYRADATWFRVDFGDGGYAVIDQNAVNTTTVDMYHTYFNSSTLQGYGTVSTTAGAVEGGWAFRGCNGAAGNGIPCGGAVLFYAPLEQGPGNPNSIYYGANILYRSADKGLNHTAVSQNLTNPISAIGISLQNDNVRIVGQNNGGLFGTTTGSATLTNLDAGGDIPNNFVARAVIDPNNVNTAYVTLSAFGVVNIWKTTNLNNAAPTWTSASSGIPQVPVNAFVVDPTNSNKLFAGTDIAVYTSTDGGASWTVFGTGLPVVAVFDMAIAPGNKLRIATHGRGMWQIPIDDVAPTVTINQAAGQLDPTTTSPINFTVVFSEAVTGFTNSDISFTGSTAGGTLAANISGAGPTYNVAVSGMTTSGTVVASIPVGVATGTVNILGNAASTSTDNTVTYNAVCNISSGAFSNVGSCNNNGTPGDPADDFFTADFTVNFVNAPATGTLQFEPGNDAIAGGGALSVSVVGLTSPYTFTGVRFKADGTTTVVEIEFSAQPTTCVRTVVGPTVSSCAAVCNISSASFSNVGTCNDNGTPANPADDFFTADVTVIFVNAPATGTLQFEPGNDAIAGGGALSVSVVGLTSPYTFTGVRFKADGTITVVEIEFSAQPTTCVLTTTGPTVSSCSSSCSLSVPGTLTVADPTFNRPVSTVALSGVGTAVRYDAIPFTVTTAGNVTISCEVADGGSVSPNGSSGVGPDMFFCLYGPGGFNPASPLTNIIAVNDDISGATNRRSRIISNLALGTYTAVLTSFNNVPTTVTDDAALPWTYSLAINQTCPVVCTITCPANITVSNNANQCGAVVTYPAPTTSGTCGTVTATPASGSFFPIGTTTVTVTSTVGPTCTFTVTVNDTQNPTITCSAPVTVSCPAAVPAPTTASVTVSDNCPGTTVVHVGDVISAQTCANRYTITRTYRATDAAGLFTNCTHTITVNDITAPTITACPAAVTVSCAAAVPAVNTSLVTATDNCTGAVVISHVGDVITAQTCANRYTLTRTYRATDVCGNFTNCVQIITVNDVTAPTITACPAAVTVSCAAAVPAVNTSLVTATDNCTGAVVITHIGDVITAQTCANRFTITRTYRATDVCGNFTECTQTITVNDITAPTITACPAAVTVSCAAAVPAVNLAAVTATDNCTGVVVISHVGDVITAQTCANKYTLTRTYRATDVCGNFTNCVQVITVNDITAPVVICPANIAAVTPVGSCTAVVSFVPTATDNCAGAVTITSVPASGSAFAIGTTTVNVTATDVCGNSSTCTFTVTVLDAQLPTITAQPVNRTVCAGSSATFNVTAVTTPNAGGPIAYQWQQWNGSAWVNVTTGTGATTSALTFANVSNLPQNTNTFRVVLTGLCTVVNSGAASLYINPLPTISLTASIPPILLPGQTLSITATVNPAGGSFVWFKNGVAIPGVTGGTFSGLTVDNLGTYRAVYTDPNGCVSTSADITVSGQPSNNLFVYPNPNTGVFQVRFYNTVNEAASVIIYDAKGARVYVQKFTTGIPYSRLDIDISRSPAGTYLVEVVNGAGKRIAAKRIVKQL